MQVEKSNLEQNCKYGDESINFVDAGLREKYLKKMADLIKTSASKSHTHP